MLDFLQLLFDAAWLQEQFDTHPRDMVAYTAFAFLLGILAGLAISKYWLMRRPTKKELKAQAEIELWKEEERQRREAERAEQERRDEAERQSLAERAQAAAQEHEDYEWFQEEFRINEKAYLAVLVDVGPRTETIEDMDDFFFKYDIEEFIRMEEIGEHTYKVSIKDDWAAFFDRHPELLDNARDWLKDSDANGKTQ